MVSLVDWNTGVSLQLSRNSVPSKSIFLTIGDNPGQLRIMVRCVWGRTPAEFHIATASVTLPPRRTLYVDILCCSRRSLSWVNVDLCGWGSTVKPQMGELCELSPLPNRYTATHIQWIDAYIEPA